MLLGRPAFQTVEAGELQSLILQVPRQSFSIEYLPVRSLLMLNNQNPEDVKDTVTTTIPSLFTIEPVWQASISEQSATLSEVSELEK